MKAIKWLGPPQLTDFGRVDTGDIIHFGGEHQVKYLLDLQPVAERLVAQGMAEWYEEPGAEPAPVQVKRKRTYKGGK